MIGCVHVVWHRFRAAIGPRLRRPIVTVEIDRLQPDPILFPGSRATHHVSAAAEQSSLLALISFSSLAPRTPDLPSPTTTAAMSTAFSYQDCIAEVSPLQPRTRRSLGTPTNALAACCNRWTSTWSPRP